MADPSADSAGPAHYDGAAIEVLAAAAGLAALEAHDDITSTLDRVHVLGAAGAAAGTAVVAERQSAGRGRSGHSWLSAPGMGVWVGLLERPTDPSAIGVLSLRLGLALAHSLAPLVATPIRLKWPNDLWTDSGTLAGILVEARWHGPTPDWVAIGVGVNVRPSPLEAQSVGLPHGVRRADVLVRACGAARRAAACTGPLSEAELSAWGALDLARGRSIVEPAAGTVRGIRSDGALLVQTATGIQAMLSGSLRFADGRLPV